MTWQQVLAMHQTHPQKKVTLPAAIGVGPERCTWATRRSQASICSSAVPHAVTLFCLGLFLSICSLLRCTAFAEDLLQVCWSCWQSLARLPRLSCYVGPSGGSDAPLVALPAVQPSVADRPATALAAMLQLDVFWKRLKHEQHIGSRLTIRTVQRGGNEICWEGCPVAKVFLAEPLLCRIRKAACKVVCALQD